MHMSPSLLAKQNSNSFPKKCSENAEQKTASDYDTGGDGGEHKLHSGKWDWHSYVLKGRRQDAFRQHCPLTAVRRRVRVRVRVFGRWVHEGSSALFSAEVVIWCTHCR